MKQVKFIATVDGQAFEFDSGSKCYIFDCAICNEFAYDHDRTEIESYVELCHYLYLKDSNDTPLGKLADYIAEHWDDVQDKDKWEILDGFYASL